MSRELRIVVVSALMVLLLSLCALKANATTYYACVTTGSGDIVIVPAATACKTGQTKIHWNQVGGGAVWYGGSNLGTLSQTPASIIQPAPRLTQAGSYLFVANVSIQETTGGYPKVTCFVRVGSTDLLPSITGVEASQQGNVTATGAITLTTGEVPAAAALVCSSTNGGTAEVTQASVSIIQVGTLRIGP